MPSNEEEYGIGRQFSPRRAYSKNKVRTGRLGLDMIKDCAHPAREDEEGIGAGPRDAMRDMGEG